VSAPDRVIRWREDAARELGYLWPPNEIPTTRSTLAGRVYRLAQRVERLRADLLP
jgi:hypothetical protein